MTRHTQRLGACLLSLPHRVVLIAALLTATGLASAAAQRGGDAAPSRARCIPELAQPGGFEVLPLVGRKIHSIIVEIVASLTGHIPAVQNALWQTYKKLDWAALRRLIDERP